MSQPLQKDAWSERTPPPKLAIGILATPAGHEIRVAARRTWLRGLDEASAVARFVIGRRHAPCNSSQLVRELRRHADFALVDAADCRKHHSAEKVHRWFQHALAAWPRTPWLAKMEDDGMLWPAALLADLGALTTATYYGVMRWSGSCPRNFGQCFGGSLPQLRPCMIKDHSRCNDAKRCCEDACPRGVRHAPFACGPLDVRHRSLARRLAACAAADELFARLTREGDLGPPCVRAGGGFCRPTGTTDGSQSHALLACLGGDGPGGEPPPPLLLADATDARFAQGPCHRCSRCARGQVVVHHAPQLKGANLTVWHDAWRAMSASAPYAPAPLPEWRVGLPAAPGAPARLNQTAIAFAHPRLPPYHPSWMAGAEGRPSCRGASAQAGPPRALAPAARTRKAEPSASRLRGRRLRTKTVEGCVEEGAGAQVQW